MTSLSSVSTFKARGAAPRGSWHALIFLWVIFALDMNSRMLFYGVLPMLTREFGLSASDAGLYTAIVTVSTALLAVPGMVWADKGGHGWKRKYRHLTIIIGYTLFTFLSGVSFLSASLLSFMILQVISHMIGGVGESVEVTSLGEWWSEQRRGFALGLHHTASPWGTLIGGIAISWVLTTYGDENWRLVFLLFPIPVIIAFGAYWLFCTKQRYEKLHADIEAAGETPPLKPETVSNTHQPNRFKNTIRNPNILAISLASLLAIVGFFGLSFWLPQYLTFVANYSAADAAAYSVLFTITGGLGQIAWGWLSDRIGRKFCLMLIFVWLAGALLLFQFASTGLGTLLLIQVVAGLVLNAPYTVIYAIAFDSAEEGAAGTAISIVNAGVYLGGVGPYVIGAIIDFGGGFGQIAGYHTALYFMSGLMLLGFVITALFTRETCGWFKRHDRALVSRAACNLA
ncbi:MFS transporter [Pseudomonas asiatica]|uniref:MFS transporter n=1 Tax=Pseudomonas asiatica TaxID=2219225 RepID=UPI002570CC0A|nr:MFS transporter [Pseudomonas asiatica]WJD71745.1 MFS transporter [Pseudomonas asiatica]